MFNPFKPSDQFTVGQTIKVRLRLFTSPTDDLDFEAGDGGSLRSVLANGAFDASLATITMIPQPAGAGFRFFNVKFLRETPGMGLIGKGEDPLGAGQVSGGTPPFKVVAAPTGTTVGMELTHEP